MTVVLFPSTSNVYQTMLRQLLWVSIICVWEVNAMYDFLQRECNIPQCNEIAGYLNTHVNVDLVSCDDFLAYACQYNTTGATGMKYIGRNDHNHQRTDYMDKKKHILADAFHEILTNTIDEKSANPALNWERAVYANCRANMNNRVNEFRKYLKQLDGANRLNSDFPINYYTNKTNDIVSWIIPDRIYANKGIGFAFFNVKIVTMQFEDSFMKDQSRYVQISPMSVDDPLNMLDFFTNYYNVSSNTDTTKHKLLRKFITEMNQITPRSTDHEDGESKDVESYTLSKWQTQWDLHTVDDFHLNWVRHLNSIGLELRADDTILVKNSAYFEHLAKKLHSTHMNAITDFVHLRYVMKTIGFVKPEYSKYSIIPEIKGFTCAPGLMIGVVNNYASKYFTLDNKRSLENMFNELKFIMKQNLELIGDNHDRTIMATKRFLRKLDASKVVIGYPEWVNSNATANFYSIKTVSDHYFQNQLLALESLQQHQAKSYLYSRSTDLYEMDTYYDSLTMEDFKFDLERNEILLPMSLFNEHDYKYFSSLLFHPINYASAGTAISQKLYYTYLEEISYPTQQNLPRCIERGASGLYHDKRKNYILDSTSWLLAVRDSFTACPGLDGLPIYFRDFGAILPKHLFYIIFAQSLCKLPNSGTEGPANHINFALANSKDFQRSFRCDENHKLYKSNSELCEPLQQYLK